jgi:16S rRNA (guanine966-N2)-methyltransferase
MRITGGDWGGQTLWAPKGQATRPTTDANREALFNILTHSLSHSPVNVLDLFAGSGSLSFESLSRGAEYCVLFEKDAEAIRTIERNRSQLKVSSAALVLVKEAKPELWLSKARELLRDGGGYDTVFCDAPYGKSLDLRALKPLLASPDVLSADCVVYVERAKEEPTPEFTGWCCVQRRDRGASSQCFFVRLKLE